MQPIQALRTVKMEENVSGKMIKLTLISDVAETNNLLVQHGQKKVTKTERKVEFNTSRRLSCRDFLWHIKRIHHWWNCAGNLKNPPLDI